MTDLRSFKHEYSDLAHDVMMAPPASFAMNVRDWLDLVDRTPEAKAIVARLEASIDFDAWYQSGLKSHRGMVGSGRLEWAKDREERLGQYLGLFRYLASDADAYMEFSTAFAWAGGRFDDSVRKIGDDYFRSFQRELLRVLERDWDAAAVPASDRIVGLTDNASEVAELRDALTDLETGMERSNSLRQDDELERNLAEVSAARRLLQATKVRISALQAVLIPALKWVVGKAAENALRIAITAVAVLLAGLFGISIPGIG